MKKQIIAGITLCAVLFLAIVVGINFMRAVQPLRSAETVTPMPQPKKVTLLAFGDSGGPNEHQKAIAAQLDKASADAIIHTGDIAYYEGTATQLKQQFDDIYSETVKKNILPTPGNHDYITRTAGPYLDYFKERLTALNAQQNGRYYSTNIGRVHVVSLDSNDSLRGSDTTMQKWLESDLASQPTNTTTVVFFHHPPFAGNTTHKSDQIVRTKLVPIFDKYRVSVVLSGHNHNYVRTCPLQFSVTKEACQKNGTTYIVTGGGGKDLYAFKEPTPSYVAKQASVFHFVKLEFLPNGAIILTAIDESGKTIDSYKF